uniref:Uncharacterized protein n=1 Tax=Buteo japonicus TaxID=224669 RepID=A0A8C0C1U6_9AVES
MCVPAYKRVFVRTCAGSLEGVGSVATPGEPVCAQVGWVAHRRSRSESLVRVGACSVRGITAKPAMGFQDFSYPRGTGNITTRQPPPPTHSNEIQQFIMSSLAAECCV